MGYTYTLRDSGHREQIVEQNGHTADYTYDSNERLDSDTYDANGNTTQSQVLRYF